MKFFIKLAQQPDLNNSHFAILLNLKQQYVLVFVVLYLPGNVCKKRKEERRKESILEYMDHKQCPKVQYSEQIKPDPKPTEVQERLQLTLDQVFIMLSTMRIFTLYFLFGHTQHST